MHKDSIGRIREGEMMESMEKFIKDDGVVLNCTSNVAKMNIFEWIWYIRELDIVSTFKESVVDVVVGIAALVAIVLLPILYPIIAYIRIKEAKKSMELYDARDGDDG